MKAQEDGRMGGWKEGRKVDGGRVGRWMGGWKEGWMGGRVGRCMEGRKEGWVEGWKEGGWMNRIITEVRAGP